MVCPNCGAEVPDGMVYCPKCGEEVQVISAVDDLEDEILREFVEDNGPGPDAGDTPAEASAEEKTSKKKHTKRNLILTIVLLAAAVVLIVFLILNRMQTSEHLFERAEDQYEQGDYDRAAKLVERSIEKDAGNAKAMLLAGKCYTELKDYISAEAMFQNAIALDPDDPDAWESLIELYDLQGKRGKILELRETVTDETILALFDDYLTPQPEIETESGTYDDYFSVEILAPEKDLDIYYTLDGTIPTSESPLYDAPIEIDSQGLTTLTAVCVDSDGYSSEPVSAEYLVELVPPDEPVVTPEGGEFSYAQTVTVTVPADSTVYYTWDNSIPGPESNRYIGPIEIPEGNHVLSLVAIDSRGMRSEVQKFNFIYYPPAVSQTIEAAAPEAVEETVEIEAEEAEKEEEWEEWEEIEEEEEWEEWEEWEEDELSSIPFDENDTPAEPAEQEEQEGSGE